MGSALTGMQKGGRDLKGVSMSSEVLGYLTRTREALCPIDLMRAFPEAALVRLQTLKLGPNDNFKIEAFGLLAVKDTYRSHGATKMVSVLGSHREITQAGKELICPIDTIYDLSNVIDGLADAAQYLLHPTILNHTHLRNLGCILKKVWMNRAGYMDIRSLVDVVKVRLAEHATAVRSKSDNQSIVLRPLDEFDIRSGEMFEEANQTSKFKAVTMSSIAQDMDGRTETVAAAMQIRNRGVNPNGEVKTYRRAVKNSDPIAAFLGLLGDQAIRKKKTTEQKRKLFC